MRTIITQVFLGVFALLTIGCNSSSSVPCPTDRELIDLFHREKQQFEQLKGDPAGKEEMAALGIRHVFLVSEAPLEIRFPVWVLDFPGPGGCSKGYAYREKTPNTLVKSIDGAVEPGSSEQLEIFRKIEGNWYLYYAAAN